MQLDCTHRDLLTAYRVPYSNCPLLWNVLTMPAFRTRHYFGSETKQWNCIAYPIDSISISPCFQIITFNLTRSTKQKSLRRGDVDTKHQFKFKFFKVDRWNERN